MTSEKIVLKICYLHETKRLTLNEDKIPNTFKELQEIIFSSRENLESYILQWFPYLQPLPDHLRHKFFKKIIDRYMELEPILKNNHTISDFLNFRDMVRTKN